MHYLITGVAGFIGSSIADRLLDLGHRVTGVDCFTDYYSRELKEENLRTARDAKNFDLIEAELSQADLGNILAHVDFIFHQAAQAGVRASWGSGFEEYTRLNVLATQRLLEACKGRSNIKKIVCASSSSVYGDAETLPTGEHLVPQPVSPYGVTKLAAEHLATLYCSQFNLPTVSLRYFTVYGPRQRPDMAFNRFIQAALLDKELEVYGDGEQSRDFTFISDAVAANLLAAEHGRNGAVYNIGGGARTTVNEVLGILTAEIGPLKVQRCACQAGDARHTSADSSLARDELGFEPKVGLVEGLQAEIRWMRSRLRL